MGTLLRETGGRDMVCQTVQSTGRVVIKDVFRDCARG